MKKIKQILSLSLVYLLLITIAPIDGIKALAKEEDLPKCLQYEKGDLKSVVQSNEGTIISYVGDDKEKLILSSVIEDKLSLLDTIDLETSIIDESNNFYFKQDNITAQGTIDATTIKSIFYNEYSKDSEKFVEELEKLEKYAEELENSEQSDISSKLNYNCSTISNNEFNNYNNSYFNDSLNEYIQNIDKVYDAEVLNSIVDLLCDDSIKELPEMKLEFNYKNTYFNILLSGKNSKVTLYNALKQEFVIITSEGYKIYPTDLLSNITIISNSIYGYDISAKQYKKYIFTESGITLDSKFDKGIIDVTKDTNDNIWALKDIDGKKYICKLENDNMTLKYQVADFMKKLYVYDEDRIIVSGAEGFTIVKKAKEATPTGNENNNTTKPKTSKLPQTGSPVNTTSLSIMSLIAIAVGTMITKKIDKLI
ncbi:hypothetical protein [uncultured Clostridium sp.]|uniref:hypothetical protein n=1 Tax=uncultured Clostridium sp. TaxID=59620 RepID=UPI0026010E4A|nr:hypothetical protein [uncultured Clostridium sp.]